MVFAILAASCGGSQEAGEALPPTVTVGRESTTTATPTTGAVPTSGAPTTSTVPASSSTAPPTTAPPTTTPTTTSTVECGTLRTGVTETTLDAGGSVHDLRIFVPSGYDGGSLLPTVLDWHGYNQSGAQQAALSGFEVLAETEGFMVVHPTGVPNPGRTQNAWELDPARDPNRDDIEFAGALIDELIGSWCADPSRVYSTGMSDGGFFTSILVCELSDRIAAATSVAGVMRPPGCQPSRVVPYYAFHGTDDPIEPFARDLAAFAEFADDAGCGPAIRFDMSTEVTALDYTDCPLSFFRIAGGGHSWPGSPVADSQPASLGHTTMDIDATTMSWELFDSVTLPS